MRFGDVGYADTSQKQMPDAKIWCRGIFVVTFFVKGNRREGNIVKGELYGYSGVLRSDRDPSN